MPILEKMLSHAQTSSIEKVMGLKPSKDRLRIRKCTVLIVGLIEEITTLTLEINKHVLWDDSSHTNDNFSSGGTTIGGVEPF